MRSRVIGIMKFFRVGLIGRKLIDKVGKIVLVIT